MSQVSMWVLSIVSIVLIGVLIEVILPQGKTNKILKSVVAVVSVLVIVSPLKNLDIDNTNFSNLFNNIEIDTEFVIDTQKNLTKALCSDIENSLESNGYSGVKIEIDATYSEEKLEIKTVFVDLKNLVLYSENLNIDKYTKIIAIIRQEVDIDKENVIFYE